MTTGYSTTNFPNGVTTAAVGSSLDSYVADDPTVVHSYFNDFNNYAAADWTITATGSVTNGLVTGDGGILSLVNSAANNDLDSFQSTVEPFVITPGKQAWLKVRFQLSNATNAAAVLGLQITDTTPLAVSDGFYFSKAAASTALNFVTEKASTATTTALGAMANTTYVTAGAHYNGSDKIHLYFNDSMVASCAVTNLPTRTLAITFAVANGTAAANTMLVDYIMIATER